MTDHDTWARDYIRDEAPLQIASAMIALAEEHRQIVDSARTVVEIRESSTSEPALRLNALTEATAKVDWQSSQVMSALAKRVAGDKAPPR